jgi:hypothetical protein
MKQVFGDTVYFLALVNGADAFHQQAVELSRHSPGPLLTTEWVLTEVGDALSQPANRPRFTQLIRLLLAQSDVAIIPASTDLFQLGCNLFAERQDKDWSLTDCISFVVMQEQKITEALTSDHHFEQAGFRCLLEA